MFAARCPQCRKVTLLSLDDLAALRPTDGGIEVRYRCLHGHEATWSPRRTRR